MSPDGQLLLRAYAVTHPSGRATLPPALGWGQLVWCQQGVLGVEVADRRWVVHGGGALWLPPTSRATAVTRTRARVRVLYLHPDRAGAGRAGGGQAGVAGAAQTVRMTAFAAALVDQACTRAPLVREDPVGEALVTLLLEALAEVDDAPLANPWPSSSLAREAAAQMEQGATVAAAARAAGFSSPSAFVASCRATLGVTPGSLVRGR